jgi:hypothetical protein
MHFGCDGQKTVGVVIGPTVRWHASTYDIVILQRASAVFNFCWRIFWFKVDRASAFQKLEPTSLMKVYALLAMALCALPELTNAEESSIGLCETSFNDTATGDVRGLLEGVPSNFNMFIRLCDVVIST